MQPNQHRQHASYQDRIYRKSRDSWWVFRHGIDPEGSPLPYSRVVYYASSEQEARQWIAARSPFQATGA